MPERITRIGLHRPVIRKVPPEEIVRLLRDKLIEEANECAHARIAKRAVELADILEVLAALCDRLGIDWAEVSSVPDETLLTAATTMSHIPDATNAGRLFTRLQREAELYDIAWSEVVRTRAERAEERGTYDNGVYLERTVWAREPHP